MKYWDEGNVLILQKNPHYWELDSQGVRLPYLNYVSVSFNDAKGTEFLLFLQGKLDFVNGIDGSFKDLVLSKNGDLKPDYAGKINLKKQQYLNTEYIGFLVDSSRNGGWNNPLTNVKVRQAINYAIDRKKIVTYFRNGIGTPATHGFIPAGMPGIHQNHIPGYDYNPVKAIQLLKEAGYPNGKGLPILQISTPDINTDVCNFIAEELNAIGIPAAVNVLQPGILRQQMSNSELNMFKAQWIADYPDPETFLAFFNGNMPAPPNYTRFKNALFDTWYQEAIVMNKDSVRYRLYERMDSLEIQQAPVIPIFYDEILHFTARRITGLRSNALNMIDLKYVKTAAE